jgi:putative acyl-CoA dehydrogenase
MTDARSYVRTTHDVTNQPPPLGDYDAYSSDLALREGALREGGSWVCDRLSAYGPEVGSFALREQAALANRYPPELHSYDRYGHRIDEVEFHPAYHALMRTAMEHEVHSLTWSSGRKGGHVAHAALLYLHVQLEAGTSCPLTMTHAAVPSLRVEPSLAKIWLPRLLSRRYDPRSLDPSRKESATIGMAMTEKQGGSDVRANASRAAPEGRAGPGELYRLTGHKWFCSAPMSDAFLTLAQSAGGLSCFLVPRFLPDGTRNRLLIQRLKDKLGNRSNASSEIEYDETSGWLVGEEGRGVATILQMVAQTRVDCAAGSAGLMRQALVEAIHHTRHRAAFGRLLSEQPLMQSVLADLALEAEACLALTLRVARSYDQAERAEERLFARIATPLAKYWVTHRAPGFAFEAMECLGGAGYIEESALPRIYREVPVNSIWEGSGNVQCLDLLRAVGRAPATLEAYFAELAPTRGADPRLDAFVDDLRRRLSDPGDLEARARRLVEALAVALQATLLVRHAPGFVAEAFLASRIAGDRGQAFGTLPPGIDTRAIVERADPLISG